MSAHSDDNHRPPFDAELLAIADYVANKKIASDLAYSTARYCLMDALGCAILALQYPECSKLLGPIVPGTLVPQGARVPGTSYVLDPILAAFNIGSLIRWLDYNDTWLAAEWGHPADNLGAILAVGDYQAQQGNKLKMQQILTAMIKAYEIQGILALENSFNRLGLDHVLLVKVASSALACSLMGGSEEDLVNTLSQAWVDGQSLRTYRHAPNTGSRKSWAAGDASSRGVWLAWLTQRGERGYPSALSAKTWGFNDSSLQGKALLRSQPYDSYVMENILFKVAYPAEFHAQTAVESAVKLYPQVKDRWTEITRIVLTTQEPAIRIISKTGPLANPADRDHCLQYMVAVALLTGDLNAENYEDLFAKDPRIDALREKFEIKESSQFTRDYLAADKRSIANSLQIFFKDGTATEEVVIEYPLGHKRRREEALPLLIAKFEKNLAGHFSQERITDLSKMFLDLEQFKKMEIGNFMQNFCRLV